MRRAALPDRTGASGAAKSACSLEQVVSPWIRAALAHGLRRLAPRGGDGVRSIRENLSGKCISLLTATIRGRISRAMKETLKKFVGKFASIRKGSGSTAKFLFVMPKSGINCQQRAALDFAVKSVAPQAQPMNGGWIIEGAL